MLIILLLIASLNSGCLGSSRLGSHSDQVVYITPEMGFIEGEYDISPLWDAMVGLQALSAFGTTAAEASYVASTLGMPRNGTGDMSP